MISDNSTHTTDAFIPLVTVDMEIDVFGSDWAYCDLLSSYLARMVSHNRADSLLYSNLFSSAVNELLETVFRNHGDAGHFECRVSRSGPIDRIELTLPCDADLAVFYESTLDRACKPDAADQYRNALFDADKLDPGIGLLELAVDYRAELALEKAGDNNIRLIADLTLEDTKH